MSKEIRTLDFQNQTDEEMSIQGYAATFDTPTVIYKIDGKEYIEVIDKKAFDKTDMKDCCLKYNHSNQVMILARTRGGSLKLKTDEKGLFFDSKLFKTSSGMDVHLLVKERVLDKCSFAFTIAPGGDIYDPKTRTRTITNIEKLWDVSIVDIPAYDSTSVQARSFFDAEAEKERLEKRERERKLKVLKLKLQLSKGE